jgi:O-antigen/teichoic acid export membrane protein
MSSNWTASGVGRTRGAQVARNALAGIASRFGMMAVAFALTPYVVHHLGLRLFGLWSLTGAVAGYLGLLDFGLAGVFVKFITEYVESERRDLVRQVVTVGALFYALFGALLAVPVVLLAPSVAKSLGLPASETHTAIWVFEALTLLLVLTLIAGIPGTVVIGMQRMEVASRNVVAAYLVQAAVTVLLLRAGWGIAALVAAGYVQFAATGLLHYRSARAIFGPIWHNPLKIEWTVTRRLFSFGGWSQLNQVLTIVSLDIGRFIAAAVVGIVSVGYYELGSRLAFTSRSIPGYFLDAIMPAAAAADTREESGALSRMYVSGTLYTVFATCGIGGFLIGASDLVVRVWMGSAYGAVSIVVTGLCIGYAFAGVAGVGMMVLRATGQPKYEAYCAGVTAVVNLAVTILLAPAYGLAGVVAGTAAGWFAGTLCFTLVFHRLRPGPWWAPIGRPALTLGAGCLALGGALRYGVHALSLQMLGGGRVWGALLVLALAFVYGTLYVGFSIVAGVWRDDPSGLLPRLLARGRIIATTGFAR